MLMFSIILIHLVLDELDFYTSIPFVKHLIETLILLLCPMFYFYAQSLIRNKHFKFKILILHAIPALIYLAYRILFNLFGFEVIDGDERNPVYMIYNWTINIQGLIYMLIILVMIKKYNHSLKDMFATLDKVKLNWLRNITLLMTFLLLIFFFENFLFLIDINFSNFFNLTSAIIAVSVYALGYMGLYRSDVFSLPEISRPISQLPKIGNEKESTGYQKSGLSSEKAQKYQAELLALMEDEQLFRDSNLTLSSLAEKLGVSTHNLSEIINTRLKMKFFDFVNGYRVEQVIKDLKDPQKENLTLVAIAFDAGFNSKSSFNAIFKKHTGKTPSEYRA